MRIGLIDVDGHNFPNLPLMKLSAWHKKQGDKVERYEPLIHNNLNTAPFDKVYMSKVFTFTDDYLYPVNAKEIIKGGTGYFYPNGGEALPYEIENSYPDYSLYPTLTKDKAYGFLTRGCPRNCDFCIVGKKEGTCSVKVADLELFWRGQKNIVLLDPNITACKWWSELFIQLIESKAYIDFTQGLDIRCITEEKAEYLKQMKIKRIHFAWDKYEEKEIIVPKLKEFKKITDWGKQKTIVYVLTNFNTTLEQDLERIYILKELGYWPYIMIYNKKELPRGHEIKKLQRWVNSKRIFERTQRFEEYKG